MGNSLKCVLGALAMITPRRKIKLQQLQQAPLPCQPAGTQLHAHTQTRVKTRLTNLKEGSFNHVDILPASN